MKKLLFAVLTVQALAIVGCKKSSEANFQKIENRISAKSSADDVRVIDGRLVFANITACEKFAQTYANVSDSTLDSLEVSMEHESYRREMGLAFYDDTKTVVESSIFGTILNKDRIYQVGDSAFYVYKSGADLKVNMLSGVTESGIDMLKSGRTGEKIYDVTDLDLYNDESGETKSAGCGSCRTSQTKWQVKKEDKEYTWGDGKNRYCKSKNVLEQIGALKSIFARITHFRVGFVFPLPGTCRFYISGCAKYQYKIKKNCYTYNLEIMQPAQQYSGYGVPSHQITYVLTSKCIRNFYTETKYAFQFETATTICTWHNYPTNYKWEKGFSSCK